MLTKKAADIPSSDITPKSTYMRRREFLAALVTLPTVSRMVTTTDTLTPKDAVTKYTNFYEFGSDKGDALRYGNAFKPSPWSVAVDGLCGKPGTYALEDILKPHPLEERVYRMRCVEGWSMVIPWDGFPLANLLKRFEPSANAKFVEFTSVERSREMPGVRRGVLPFPYREGLRMDEAMHPLTILAAGLYGETLLTQNGAPLRLVVPWKYGYKGIKSIVRIRFVDKQPLNTWQEANPYYYGFYANVNPAVPTPTYSQATERRIGEFLKRNTLPFNGYGDQVASMYAGMDPKRLF
ncbi:MAG TPA: protein-methionine-sulfoxide reductase catalytic subunit MsrP [Vicinamibacterales bacterium]|nr:protein-methionine-sulfoxide reductase catalytic subunit MsrP [Vicinamibacterales bacterium]